MTLNNLIAILIPLTMAVVVAGLCGVWWGRLFEKCEEHRKGGLTGEDISEKYGNVTVYFDGYYKYVFTFRGEANDGTVILASYGGDSGSIYRFAIGDNGRLLGSVRFWKQVEIIQNNRTIYVYRRPQNKEARIRWSSKRH